LVLRFVITAILGTKRVYWGGQNDNLESIWFTNIEAAYKVPGRHYMNIQVWQKLPDDVNHLDGQRCTTVPVDLEVEEHWIDD